MELVETKNRTIGPLTKPFDGIIISRLQLAYKQWHIYLLFTCTALNTQGSGWSRNGMKGEVEVAGRAIRKCQYLQWDTMLIAKKECQLKVLASDSLITTCVTLDQRRTELRWFLVSEILGTGSIPRLIRRWFGELKLTQSTGGMCVRGEKTLISWPIDCLQLDLIHTRGW